jgi:hypothetical protein
MESTEWYKDMMKFTTGPLSSPTVYSFVHTPPKAGSNFPSDVAANLDKSHVVVVFWGKESANSAWVDAEIKYAVAKEKLIIPVLIDDGVQLPPSLRYTQAICAFDDPHGWLINLHEQINESRIMRTETDMERERNHPATVDQIRRFNSRR